jgi:hypothetical protein
LAVEFSPPSGELSQGDIFAAVPSAYVEDARFMVKVGPNSYAIQSDSQPRRGDRMYPANAVEARSFALLLTHDCEIDKNARRALAQLSLIRPLRVPDIPEEHIGGFRDNTRHRAFYLPPNDFLVGENYADLRRTTAIRVDALMEFERLASMNEDGRRMLREQLFRFFTRRYLPDAWVDWPEDAE